MWWLHLKFDVSIFLQYLFSWEGIFLKQICFIHPSIFYMEITLAYYCCLHCTEWVYTLIDQMMTLKSSLGNELIGRMKGEWRSLCQFTEKEIVLQGHRLNKSQHLLPTLPRLQYRILETGNLTLSTDNSTLLKISTWGKISANKIHYFPL